MKQGQASPAVESRGTQAERIVLTRGELIKILSGFADFVKDKEAEDFPGWVDGVFNAARRDGAIVFDREAPAGQRFQEAIK
jgi:hypothetical protein